MIAFTSSETYHDLRKSGELGDRQREVLSLVRLNPGKTAQELTTIAHYRDPNRVRPRLVELAHNGYIECAGNRLCTETGRMAMTWRIRTYREQGELFE